MSTFAFGLWVGLLRSRCKVAMVRFDRMHGALPDWSHSFPLLMIFFMQQFALPSGLVLQSVVLHLPQLPAQQICLFGDRMPPLRLHN